jgi:hypothetical protein
MGCRFSASFVSPFADFRGLVSAPPFALSTSPVPGRVVRVFDALTVDFVTNRVPEVLGLFCFGCRLAGVEVPGRGSPLATSRLCSILAISDSMAFASFLGFAPCGRHLIRLFTPAGVDLNSLLLSEGLALPL